MEKTRINHCVVIPHILDLLKKVLACVILSKSAWIYYWDRMKSLLGFGALT